MKANLLALLLLGAVAAPTAWAEEGSGGAGATHQGSSAPATSAGHGAEGTGKVETGGTEVNVQHGGSKGDAAANPIDTRIAEPPRGMPNSNKLHDWTKTGRTAAPLAPKPFVLRHPAAPSAGENATTKNAIGATLHDQAGAVGLEPGRGGPYAGPGTGLRPGGSEPAALGGTPRTGGVIGKPGGVTVFSAPAVRSPATGGANRSAINGTGVAHPGSGPAVLGGPAKSAVGINGTNIRSKH